MEATQSKTFLLPRRGLMFVLSGMCFISAIAPLILDLAFAGRYTGESRAWMFFSLFWGGSTIVFLLWAWKTKLTVSPTGIVYHGATPLKRMRVEWANMEELIDTGRNLILILREPAQPLTPATKWVYDRHFAADTVVDLTEFMEYWKRGTLKEDFKTYAPHLFKQKANKILQ